MTYYDDMPANSKVWVYQSNRPFRDVEVQGIRHKLREFILEWTAHGAKLKAFGDVYYNQFIVVMVDEAQATASGCSIDASVHFIKEIEKTFDVDLFDRLTVAYMQGQEVILSSKDDVKQKMNQGEISEDTIIFNNLVNNKDAFESKWKIPLKESWVQTLVA